MADTLRRLNLMPWISGYAMYGHPTIKRADGLQVAKNQIRDFDGTMHRRGGQAHIHRNPIYEGQAFQDHFLGTKLKDAWTEASPASASINFGEASKIRVSGTGANNGSIQATLDDADGVTTVRSLSSTVTTINVVTRIRITAVGNEPNGQRYLELDVDPGDGTWRLRVRFVRSGIYIVQSDTTFAEIVAHGTAVDTLSCGSSIKYITDDSAALHGEFLTYRWEISKTGSDYFADMYIENVLVFSGIPLLAASGTDGYVKFGFGTTTSALDVTIDQIEVDATLQKIRGVADWNFTARSGAEVSSIACFAGTRVYVYDGDFYNLKCIDDGLDTADRASFAVYQEDLFYATSNSHPLRRYENYTRVGAEVPLAPNCSMLREHANRLFVTGDWRSPYRLYWCGLLDATVWNTEEDPGLAYDFTNAGYIDVDSNSGGHITGLGESFQRVMPIYKTHSLKRLNGVSPPFTIEPISDVLGGTAHGATANLLNDQLFLARSGAHSVITTDKYGELESEIYSRDLRTLWLREVNLDALENAWMVNYEAKDQIWVLVPAFDAATDVREPSRAYLLHYGTRSEVFPMGLWTDARIVGYSMCMARFDGNFDRMVVIGGDGYLNQQDKPSRLDFPVFAA